MEKLDFRQSPNNLKAKLPVTKTKYSQELIAPQQPAQQAAQLGPGQVAGEPLPQ